MIDCERIDDMEYEEKEVAQDDKKEFKIVSDLMAEWAIKKISKATEEYERLVRLANDEIKQINSRMMQEENKYINSTGYLKNKLFEYFCKVAHKETKTQETYKLLSGTLVLKKPCKKINKPLDQDLLNILHQTGENEFIEMIEKPKWAEYKKTLTITPDGTVVNANGEIVSIEAIDEPGEFNVKF